MKEIWSVTTRSPRETHEVSRAVTSYESQHEKIRKIQLVERESPARLVIELIHWVDDGYPKVVVEIPYHNVASIRYVLEQGVEG